MKTLGEYIKKGRAISLDEKTKRLWQLLALLAVDFIMLAAISVSSSARSQAVCLGCSGERVSEIQRRLNDKGFYCGEINGSYDFATRQSVRKFRKASGLKSGSDADYQTLNALGINSHSECFSAQTEILARYIESFGGNNYLEMLQTGTQALEHSGGTTLCLYLMQSEPEFRRMIFSGEPSSEAYAAAIQSLRLFSKQSPRSSF